MQPTHLAPLRSLPLTPAQISVLTRACSHEQVRAYARTKDERLGDETREREHVTLGELKVVIERLRALAP